LKRFICCLVVIFATSVASLSTPWWSYDFQVGDCLGTDSYSWMKGSYKCNAQCNAGLCGDTAYDWRQYACHITDTVECNALPPFYDTALAMMVLSTLLIFSLIMILVLQTQTLVLHSFLLYKATQLSLVITAAIFGLIAIIVFATGIPSAYHDAKQCKTNSYGCSFIGSDSFTLVGVKVGYDWGPGPGWIIEVVNTVLIVAFAILYFIKA